MTHATITTIACIRRSGLVQTEGPAASDAKYLNEHSNIEIAKKKAVPVARPNAAAPAPPVPPLNSTALLINGSEYINAQHPGQASTLKA